MQNTQKNKLLTVEGKNSLYYIFIILFNAQDPETGELLEDISAKELAYRILDSGKYTGGPIRLLACNAGQLENGAAQQLADLLRVPVLAPTKTLISSPDGYMAITDDFDEAAEIMSEMSRENRKWNSEGWRLFKPKGEHNEDN